jgi:hypothetical protein
MTVNFLFTLVYVKKSNKIEVKISGEKNGSIFVWPKQRSCQQEDGKDLVTLRQYLDVTIIQNFDMPHLNYSGFEFIFAKFWEFLKYNLAINANQP